jgi:hypothetical protein
MTEQTEKIPARHRSLDQNQKIQFRKMVEAGKPETTIAKYFQITVRNVQKRIKAMGLTPKVNEEIKKDIVSKVKELKAAEAFSKASKITQDNYDLVQNLFNNLATLNGLIELNKNRIILAEKMRGKNKDDRKHQEFLLKTISEINKTAETLVDLRKQLLSDEEIRIFKDAVMLWIENKNPEFKKELINAINSIRFSRQLNGINSRNYSTGQPELSAHPANPTSRQGITVLEEEGVLEGREPSGHYRIL